MGRLRTFLLSSWLVGFGGCSGDSTSRSDVTGRWCGKAVTQADQCTGDGVEYADFKMSGAGVTGQLCEAFAKECYDIVAGSFSGNQLTFSYTFGTDRVDAALTLSGDTLEGQFTSTKASQPIPITLHRIP